MDLFGSSSDSDTSPTPPPAGGHREIVMEVVKAWADTNRRLGGSGRREDFLVGVDGEFGDVMADLMGAGFKVVAGACDCVVCKDYAQSMGKYTVAFGGTIITMSDSASSAEFVSTAVGCDTRDVDGETLPWLSRGLDDAEIESVGDITVPRSAKEAGQPFYAKGSMSERTVRGVKDRLEKYGVCLIRRLVNPDDVRTLAQAALGDVEDAISSLEKKGISVLNPELTGDPLSYRELSMREDLRVDIRSGPRLDKAKAEVGGVHDRIRSHPGILEALTLLMNPTSDDGSHMGDFGAWNFGGSGPGVPVQPKVSGAGAVISFPGSADQAVHADASHLFSHVQLPPHYVNLFVSGFEGQREGEGGTAFVLGSHKLGTCAEMMAGGRRDKMERAIVRPVLNPGDVLLFDTRVLHFGMANTGTRRRPLLYFNFTKSFYQDPKNWDNRESLFKGEGSST